VSRRPLPVSLALVVTLACGVGRGVGGRLVPLMAVASPTPETTLELSVRELPEPEAMRLDPVRADELAEHVDVLAADLFEGREVGTKGARLAAGYLVDALETIDGLRPAGSDGWFHEFRFRYPDRERFEKTPGRNVAALLPGSDAELFDEVVVVGAHYDHVGYGRHGNSLGDAGRVHNGADDNASGTAAVLEIAEALATRPGGTRRSILFLFFSGEEIGLAGSRAFVEAPTVPLDAIVAMLNLDMIGRVQRDTLLVGGTGTSPGFSALVRGLCGEMGIDLVEETAGTAPSDNLAFYEAGIPSMFVFSGVHGDYHRPGDDSWRVNAEGMRLATELVLAILDRIDARDEPPPFTEAPGEVPYWTPVRYLGAGFGNPRGERGVARVTVVVPDSPAERAGLREGDVVLALDGESPAGRRAFERLLKGCDVNAEHELTVLRAGPDGPRERTLAFTFEIR